MPRKTPPRTPHPPVCPLIPAPSQEIPPRQVWTSLTPAGQGTLRQVALRVLEEVIRDAR